MSYLLPFASSDAFCLCGAGWGKAGRYCADERLQRLELRHYPYSSRMAIDTGRVPLDRGDRRIAWRHLLTGGRASPSPWTGFGTIAGRLPTRIFADPLPDWPRGALRRWLPPRGLLAALNSTTHSWRCTVTSRPGTAQSLGTTKRAELANAALGVACEMGSAIDAASPERRNPSAALNSLPVYGRNLSC